MGFMLLLTTLFSIYYSKLHAGGEAWWTRMSFRCSSLLYIRRNKHLLTKYPQQPYELYNPQQHPVLSYDMGPEKHESRKQKISEPDTLSAEGRQRVLEWLSGLGSISGEYG